MRPRNLGRVSASALALFASALLLAACAAPGSGAPPTQAPSPTPTAAATADATADATEPPRDLEGFVVALDPGHNGGNAKNPDEATALVPDGRGGQKACNTTGTATADGYPEHEFTWEVAAELQDLLVARGATVVLSRDSNDGVGPCIDERGTFASEADADLLLSIHANGNEDTSASGFHLIVADPPLNDAQGLPSRSVAEAIREALKEAGRSVNPAYGDSGIAERPDLGGLNHASVPAVIAEVGEMNNPDEGAFLASAGGRSEIAAALATGTASWLLDRARE